MERAPTAPAPSETRVTAGPDADWLPATAAYPLARVGKKRLLEAIAAGELAARREGRRTYVRRDELLAWAPRPVHLTPPERALERAQAGALWRAGSNVHVIAAELGRSTTTIAGYLDELGIERTKGPRPTYPPAEPRVCGRDGCDVVFTPDGWRVAEGGGVYCSEECSLAVFVETYSIPAVYPEPEPRTCEGCGVVFTPPRANAGRGDGRFHSQACAASHRFRRPDGGGLVRLVERGHLYSGRKRQELLGRWKGTIAARAAAAAGRIGRPRGYTDEQAAVVRALKAKHPTWGRGTIASEARLTEKQVRAILAQT